MIRSNPQSLGDPSEPRSPGSGQRYFKKAAAAVRYAHKKQAK